MASSFNRKSASSASKGSRRSLDSSKRGRVSSGADSSKPKRVTYGSASASGAASATGRRSLRHSSSREASSPSGRSSYRSRSTASADSSSARASRVDSAAVSAGSAAPEPIDATSSQKPARSSRRNSTRSSASTAALEGGKKQGRRKSIKDKAAKGSRKRDKAPAGTADLSVSQSDQRRRNHDVDDVASGAARRVGDIRASRAAERAARARKRYLSYILKLFAVVFVVVVVFFSCIFIYRSDLLAVETVTVTGAAHLTDQEVTQLAAVPDDSTLLRLDSAGICERLEEHPWVKSAQISRQFPHSIKIQITERTPAAVVKLSKKSIWVISTDGAWLSAATTQDWKDYHRIVDVDANLSTPVAGSECTDEGVLNALKIYDGVSSDFASTIKSISAASAVKASLTLKGGVTVAFGEAQDIELKEADVNTLLDKYSGSISYINVRVPDRPTYRTAKESE